MEKGVDQDIEPGDREDIGATYGPMASYGNAEAKWNTNPEDHRQNEGFVSTKTVFPIRFISKVWVSQAHTAYSITIHCSQFGA